MQRSSNREECILVAEETATAVSGGFRGSLARESSIFLGLSCGMTLAEILARKTPFVFSYFPSLFFSPLPSSGFCKLPKAFQKLHVLHKESESVSLVCT